MAHCHADVLIAPSAGNLKHSLRPNNIPTPSRFPNKRQCALVDNTSLFHASRVMNEGHVVIAKPRRYSLSATARIDVVNGIDGV